METTTKPLGQVIEGEESEEEEEEEGAEIESSDGELTEEIRVKTVAAAAAGGLVCEGEDDEEEEDYVADNAEAKAHSADKGAAEEADTGEVQMIEHDADRRESLDISATTASGSEAASTAPSTAGTPSGKAVSSYGSLGAFSEAFVPLLKPRRKTLAQEQSAAERKIARHNQGIRTTIGAKMHHTYQSTHKDVTQVSHQLDLVRNVTQDLNIKVRSINDDLEKLTAIVDKTCSSFLQLLQPSIHGRTMHT